MNPVMQPRSGAGDQVLQEADLADFFEEPLSELEAQISPLPNAFEIKQRWLRSEWDQRCQFSGGIRPHFPDRRDLSPSREDPDIQKITTVFHDVRGKYILWQDPREQAIWRKVVVGLPLEWAERNVEILYPSPDRFDVPQLDGIVLWDEGKSSGRKRYQLYEGNHRFSTWLASRGPPTLPAIIFIGQPKK